MMLKRDRQSLGAGLRRAYFLLDRGRMLL